MVTKSRKWPLTSIRTNERETMTDQEKLQPRSTFVEAGKVACRIGINFIDNPYKDEPFKSAWEKGYELENNKNSRITFRYKGKRK